MELNKDNSIYEPQEYQRKKPQEMTLLNNTLDDSNIFKTRFENNNVKYKQKDPDRSRFVFTNSMEMDYTMFKHESYMVKEDAKQKSNKKIPVQTIVETKKEDIVKQEEGYSIPYFVKLVLFTSLVAVQVIVVIKYYKNIKEMYKFVIQEGEAIAKKDNFWTYFILIFIEFALAIQCLPGKTGINMIEAFFIPSMIKIAIITIICPWLFGVIAYFTAYKVQREWLLEKMIESPYYIIICKEVKKSPYQTVVLLFLQPHPPGLNSYLLPLVGLKLKPFLLGTFPFYAFFGGLSILMGKQLDGLNNNFVDEDNQGGKSWEELDNVDKIIKIVSWFQLIAACGVFIGQILWFKRKMKDYDLILEQKANGELELDDLFTPLKYAKRDQKLPKDPLNRNCDLRLIDHIK